MSEQAEVVESSASPEVQVEAEKLGWIPPTRYKGDAERFVDAEEFIKRGETVLPIVKEQNRRLKAEIETVRGESRKVADALAQAQKAIEEIEERHTVATQKAVAKARAEVKTQLAAASEAGDHVGVAELTDQLTQLQTAEDKPKTEKTTTPTQTVEIPDEVKAWNARNTWFGTDRPKTNLALGIAEELRMQGETALGEVFFDKVKEITERRYVPDGEKRTPESKVEGGRNGSGADTPTSRGKSFSSLPVDAKAACEAEVKRFVGEGKRFKTKAEWQNRYAEIYYQES